MQISPNPNVENLLKNVRTKVSIKLQCSVCEYYVDESIDNCSKSTMVISANNNGWEVVDDKVFCPICTKSFKKYVKKLVD